MLKIELATLFARAELSELGVQTTSPPHYSAYLAGSGLTSNESKHESTELTYTDLSNVFNPIDLSQFSCRDA